MSWEGGMLYAANLNSHLLSVHLHNGNVLFARAIGSVGNQFGHWFSAANHVHTAAEQMGDDVAAMLADIN